ncbi:Lrp/AsnC family transcriptional regulator [Antribacter sp. KLBMP9083]|uniref:Lrp/AsnC family transcriptional regulator n=1 Tax=Antribacter soli TaxID=2910976 RepID=A0AA41QDB3_9MICO|nr:Lrp/AsnC family transcriptional regulator [Antribacter soli]MCF4121345.1 Lrp/AsnC family transcriptional regulator [Antribacter soli]
MTSTYQLDPLDARLLLALDEDPEASVVSLARTLGVARNTVHARLRRLEKSHALGDVSRRLAPEALGRGLTAFVAISLSQAEARAAYDALADIPEVIEVHATTGDADLLARVVARDAAGLRSVTAAITAAPGVQRTSTSVALEQVMPYRLSALLERLAREGEARPAG